MEQENYIFQKDFDFQKLANETLAGMDELLAELMDKFDSDMLEDYL